MVDGIGVVADVVLDLGVALGGGGGRQFFAANPRQCGLRQNLAHQLEAANQAVHVVTFPQKIGINHRRLQRVFAGQCDTATAARTQQAHVARVAMAKGGGAAMIEQFGDDKVQLQVRDGLTGLALDEATGLGEIGGEHAAAQIAPLENALDGAHHAAQ